MTSPDIIKVFKDNRPNLTMSSLRTYSSIIRNLCKALGLPHDPAKLADSYKKVIEHYKDTDPKVRKTRLSAVLIYILNTKNEKAVDLIRQSMMSDSAKVRKEEESQVMSEKEKTLFSDFGWEDVLDTVKKYEQEVAKLGDKKDLNKKEFRLVQSYVILRCLTDIPPRRSQDWVKFAIRDYDEKEDEVNFMRVLTEKIKRKTIKRYQFVFREYKTKKVYGEQALDIPEALGKLIEWWMERNPHPWLLMNVSRSGPITQVQLSHMLNDIFGRNVSTSALRHLYLMDKYTDVDDEQKRDAEYMGHSTQEQKNYILKK
jgi:hypothetical protein